MIFPLIGDVLFKIFHFIFKVTPNFDRFVGFSEDRLRQSFALAEQNPSRQDLWLTHCQYSTIKAIFLSVFYAVHKVEMN